MNAATNTAQITPLRTSEDRLGERPGPPGG